jgi:hypothetical protein
MRYPHTDACELTHVEIMYIMHVEYIMHVKRIMHGKYLMSVNYTMHVEVQLTEWLLEHVFRVTRFDDVLDSIARSFASSQRRGAPVASTLGISVLQVVRVEAMWEWRRFHSGCRLAATPCPSEA